MAQVSFDFASELVALGYAHLTHFTPEHTAVAEIAFLPDPVCTWLAMTHMIEDCNLLEKLMGSRWGVVCSEHASVWSEKAMKIYSSALCRYKDWSANKVANWPRENKASAFNFSVLRQHCVQLEIEVPNEDDFGATNLALCSTCGGGEEAEVMLSHEDLALGADYKFARLLRRKTKGEDPSKKTFERDNGRVSPGYQMKRAVRKQLLHMQAVINC